MDTRLYILAGTFLLLVLSVIYLMIASVRAARMKRSMVHPAFTIDAPALPSAEIVVQLDPDERDARFAPPQSDVYSAMQEPLRTGSWRPDQQEPVVPDVPTMPERVEETFEGPSDDRGVPAIEDAYVAELIDQLGGSSEIEDSEIADISEIMSQLESAEVAQSVELHPSADAARSASSGPVVESREPAAQSSQPAPPAAPVPQEQAPAPAPVGGGDYWTRLIDEQERLVQRRSAEDVPPAPPVAVEVPVSPDVAPAAITPPAVVEPDATLEPVVPVEASVEVRPPVESQFVPIKGEAATLTTFAAESGQMSPHESVVSETQVPELILEPAPEIAAIPEPALMPEPVVTPELLPMPEPVAASEPASTPEPVAARVPVPLSQPVIQPVPERPSAVVPRERDAEPRPKTMVSPSAVISPSPAAGASVPGSPLPHLRTVDQVAARNEVEDRSLVAPVEMWFGDFRIGVKAGTRTYEQFRRYADVILRDLAASERARGLR